MTDNAQTNTPRREWPRIPVPPALFDLLVVIAKTRGMKEETLYRLIALALREGLPDDWEKLSGYFDVDWIPPPTPEETPPEE